MYIADMPRKFPGEEHPRGAGNRVLEMWGHWDTLAASVSGPWSFSAQDVGPGESFPEVVTAAVSGPNRPPEYQQETTKDA